MTPNRSMTLAIACLLTAVTVATSYAQISDQQIETLITQKLRDETSLREVEVTVEEQVATLSGTVPSLWAKDTAIEAAFKVEGVQLVVSDLTVARAEKDDIVWEQVAKSIRRYSLYTMFDHVDMGVDDGVVTIVGKVTEAIKVADIGRLVSRVSGVRELNNHLETLPPSPVDSRVRTELANRIYNHPVLSRYANRPDPPIHIIVENGRVILTGAVNSELEKRIAGSVVRGTFGVLSIDNKLQIG